MPFLIGGLPGRDDFRAQVVPGAGVAFLHGEPAGQGAHVQHAHALRRGGHEYAQVRFLLREPRGGLGRDFGRDQHFQEGAARRLRRLQRHGRADGDHAAEHAEGVGVTGAFPGGLHVVRDGHAAGVGVLDGHAHRHRVAVLRLRLLRREFLAQRPRGVRVSVIVEAHGFARHDLRVDDRPDRAAQAVDRARLVRVLAVPHLGGPAEVQGQRLGQRGGQLVAAAFQVGGDGRVVLAGVPVRLGGQPLPVGGAHVVLKRHRVVCGVHEDQHARVVLRRRADHGRPADIDVLDGLVERRAARHRLPERVKVHAHQIDGADPVRVQLPQVTGFTPRQDPAVHGRVQRLHAAVQHLREARHVTHLPRRDARRDDAGVRAAGTQDLPAARLELPRELHHARLVTDREQRPFPALPRALPAQFRAVLRHVPSSQYQKNANGSHRQGAVRPRRAIIHSSGGSPVVSPRSAPVAPALAAAYRVHSRRGPADADRGPGEVASRVRSGPATLKFLAAPP